MAFSEYPNFKPSAFQNEIFSNLGRSEFQSKFLEDIYVLNAVLSHQIGHFPLEKLKLKELTVFSLKVRILDGNKYGIRIPPEFRLVFSRKSEFLNEHTWMTFFLRPNIVESGGNLYLTSSWILSESSKVLASISWLRDSAASPLTEIIRSPTHKTSLLWAQLPFTNWAIFASRSYTTTPKLVWPQVWTWMDLSWYDVNYYQKFHVITVFYWHEFGLICQIPKFDIWK